jgi:hypothetical protein
MRVCDLKPGMLVRPKDGYAWRKQKSAYLEKVMCLTVVPTGNKSFIDEVVMYVGERDDDMITYGKQIVLWDSYKISVNPAAWRCIVSVK